MAVGNLGAKIPGKKETYLSETNILQNYLLKSLDTFKTLQEKS